MKKQSSQKAIETHCLRQQRFPLPGTDLGYLNAQPMDFVPDVDGESTNYPPQFTFSEPKSIRRK